jgi:hypothetical protein
MVLSTNLEGSMEPKNILWAALALAATLTSNSVVAGGIGWTPVTPGNMQWGQQSSGITTYRQIGPYSYGSDGSTSYNGGGSTPESNISVDSDGNRYQRMGDMTHVETPDGRKFWCRMQGTEAVCRPE